MPIASCYTTVGLWEQPGFDFTPSSHLGIEYSRISLSLPLDHFSQLALPFSYVLPEACTSNPSRVLRPLQLFLLAPQPSTPEYYLCASPMWPVLISTALTPSSCIRAQSGTPCSAMLVLCLYLPDELPTWYQHESFCALRM